jgi:hypothetical protein
VAAEVTPASLPPEGTPSGRRAVTRREEGTLGPLRRLAEGSRSSARRSRPGGADRLDARRVEHRLGRLQRQVERIWPPMSGAARQAAHARARRRRRRGRRLQVGTVGEAGRSPIVAGLELTTTVQPSSRSTFGAWQPA